MYKAGCRPPERACRRFLKNSEIPPLEERSGPSVIDFVRGGVVY